MKKLVILLIFAVIAIIPNRAFAANETILSNKSAKIDVTNATDGYVKAAYVGGGGAKIKLLITSEAGVQYQYSLNVDGKYETFPLSEGNGKYKFDVCKNVDGTKYSVLFTTKYDVKIKDEFVPFLVPNQYVNYTDTSQVVVKAKELTENITDDLGKIKEIYNFVVTNFTYDEDKAKAVVAKTLTGYLPAVDEILEIKKGICFDYAAVTAAMLRSVKIPCRLIVGYADEVSHAWINTYSSKDGTINSVIEFDGKTWKLMDPTFASSAKQSKAVMKYIGDGSHYTPRFKY